MWHQSLKQRHADQVAMPGNVADERGAAPPTGQALHANQDVSLRREIDDLKKLIE